MEKRYLSNALRIRDFNILAIDGGLRSHLFVLFQKTKYFENFEMIIVDNVENRFPSVYLSETILNTYVRLDFIAGSLDTQLPKFMNGKHITTVFVNKDRYQKCEEVVTENPYKWASEDLVKYQNFQLDEKTYKITETHASNITKILEEYALIK
jgi:hypothetical protein